MMPRDSTEEECTCSGEGDCEYCDPVGNYYDTIIELQRSATARKAPLMATRTELEDRAHGLTAKLQSECSMYVAGGVGARRPKEANALKIIAEEFGFAMETAARRLRRSVCHALVLHDAKRHRMVCQVCGGTGLGGASVVHARDCALGDLTDTWPGDKVLRQPQRERLVHGS